MRFFREGDSVWLNPSSRNIASVPRRSDIKEGTVRSICKQFGIPQP